MRCDSDPIFKGDTFKEVAETYSVDLSYSAPYTPTQNTIQERRWGIIAAPARVMLHTASLPAAYWEFAAMTACYLNNRTYHRSINGVPLTLASGRTPDLSHLRIFACPAYVHIPQHQRRKMADTAFKGILVGYPTDTYGYLIYNPRNRKVITTRHVRFDETYALVVSWGDSWVVSKRVEAGKGWKTAGVVLVFSVDFC
jgi:hypothetical protein